MKDALKDNKSCVALLLENLSNSRGFKALFTCSSRAHVFRKLVPQVKSRETASLRLVLVLGTLSRPAPGGLRGPDASDLLKDIQLEDLEDGLRMRNQWLIRTPRKSFYVAAASYEEKQAWIEHIQDCQSSLLQSGGHRPGSTFAATWIPDQASAICMRCSNRFTVAHRRHHCRKCGFVVCGACSKKRAVIRHIHPTKRVRVCTTCHSGLSKAEAEPQEVPRPRGHSTEKIGSDEDDVEESSEEDEAEEQMDNHDPRRWMDSKMDSWSPYVYLKPEHERPPNTSAPAVTRE